jgi:hypothetical protein
MRSILQCKPNAKRHRGHKVIGGTITKKGFGEVVYENMKWIKLALDKVA